MKHPVLALIVFWNLLFLGINLRNEASMGWVVWCAFGAVVAASVWTQERSRDRRLK